MIALPSPSESVVSTGHLQLIASSSANGATSTIMIKRIFLKINRDKEGKTNIP
jgi:hypothetical protein